MARIRVSVEAHGNVARPTGEQIADRVAALRAALDEAGLDVRASCDLWSKGEDESPAPALAAVEEASPVAGQADV